MTLRSTGYAFERGDPFDSSSNAFVRSRSLGGLYTSEPKASEDIPPSDSPCSQFDSLAVRYTVALTSPL